MASVGIEKIWAYPGSMSLEMTALCRARGKEPSYATEVLSVDRRTVSPCWEDVLTLAVNAAKPMLDEDDLQTIQLVVVGTESSWDQGKPLSTWVHHYLGIQRNCRNYETKMACYGGTAALMTAAHWVRSQAAPGKKALVIATDQSRDQLGFPSEFVMGGGAVAMLVSDTPKVIELELERSGYYSAHVEDTFRPTSTTEKGDEESSVYCYLEALEGAYEHFRQRVGGEGAELDKNFALHVYHTPFGGMSRLAHRHLAKYCRGKVDRRAFDAEFERKVAGALTYTRHFGGTYSGSVYLGLLGTLERSDYRAGDRISIFSYGSGSCAEFYSAKICPEAREVVKRVRLAEQIERRRAISVEQYEAVERRRQGYIDAGTYKPATDTFGDHYQSFYQGKGLLVLRGLEDYFRTYDWS